MWIMLIAAVVVVRTALAAQLVYLAMRRPKQMTLDEVERLRIDVAMLGDAVERLREEVEQLKTRTGGASSPDIKEL